MDETKELQSLTTPKGVYDSFRDKYAREQIEELKKNGNGSGQNVELPAGLENALTAFFANIRTYIPAVLTNTTEHNGAAVIASATAVLDALSGDAGTDQPSGSGGVVDNGRTLTITGGVSVIEDGDTLRFA